MLTNLASKERKCVKPCMRGAQTGSYTNFFADALIAEAELDARVVGIHAAMGGGTGMNRFEKRFFERTFDVGIAEQARGRAAPHARSAPKRHSMCRAQDVINTAVCVIAGALGTDGRTQAHRATGSCPPRCAGHMAKKSRYTHIVPVCWCTEAARARRSTP